ncbi:hypothetical protein [Pedobacter sp. SL55]|uniref:hypothetical protein n=1 Tax=Pedobacter sp. SL55 TaxID=2995161 RepID=UPI0022703C50|nr:hypothetical protein [Pedobacter sp. SL55]WAC40285.1 hypothetical protein OVA16_17185 [Pedobacter sp. SL55]
MVHQFHIPVLGLGFSVDTPLKVARYGISSVVSIVDDELVERMRKYHSQLNHLPYHPIDKKEIDYRTKRITAYLNLLHDLVDMQFEALKKQGFTAGSDICRYFELLPEGSVIKHGYELMMEYPEGERKRIFQDLLRQRMKKGSIDVNIMAKVDKLNFAKDGEYLGDENTDALAALRGFANSKVNGSVVLSAGMNPRLYSYIEKFEGFYPNQDGAFNKRIILKVSDFRSALIQAKFLAKKGLWVSEFRIESGLNCGGHAFATDGFLLGPILEDFKQNRIAMRNELEELYKKTLAQKEVLVSELPHAKVTVQGGIGTAQENEFLLKYYNLDATGWGSPFLLVPEVTNVDEQTLQQLTVAKQEDYYLSNSSPLGVLFNNFKYSSAEQQRLDRIAAGKPGSPCTKKYLCSNTEFTKEPICTASSKYQKLKINQLNAQQLSTAAYQDAFRRITEKLCLCEGLCTSTYIKTNMLKPKESKAVVICPGPNLAFFNKVYSLDEMVKHIYGNINLLDKVQRPHVFVNELNLYIDYLQTEVQLYFKNINDKKKRHLDGFKNQLQKGIAYYKDLFSELSNTSILTELSSSENRLLNTHI